MEEIIENKLTEDGFRQLKVISDLIVTDAQMMRFVPLAARDHAQVRCHTTSTLSLFYGEARWPVRGDAVDIHCEGWPKFRRLVAWKILPGERMSESISHGRLAYVRLFVRCPRYAFTKTMPKSVEYGIEIENIMLFQADWALPGCLLIGG